MRTLRALAPLLVIVAALGVAPADPASAADAWAKVFSRPFTATAGNDRIFRTAVVGTELAIAAVRASPAGTNLYRLNHAGCALWDNLALPWSPATSGSAAAMTAFKSRLYVGTDPGLVFAYDGSTWANVSGNLPAGWLRDIAEFNGTLYVAYVDAVWQLVDDTTVPHVWTKVWAPVFSSPHPDLARIESLQAFNGHLYVGVGLDNANGIQIWRMSPGLAWTLFRDETNWGLCSGCLGHVHALRPFGGYLYIGSYHGVDLYRTDGTPGSWQYIAGAAQTGAGNVFRLLEHNSKFYLGTSNLSSAGSPGTPMLYESVNGTVWTAVPGGPTVSTATHSVTALASHGGRLYVATAGQSELAVHQLGPAPAPGCDPPVPDLKLNGLDGPWVTLAQGASLTVSVAMKAGTTLAGKTADWWVIVLYYDAAHGLWWPFWLTVQAPLADVTAFDLWKNVDTSGFAKGLYALGLVVDFNANGLLDADAMFLDGIWMTIQ